jgi:hypothetical protein
MTRIVTYAHRYKRPPRKRKAVALEARAVVITKKSRRPVWGETAAEVDAPASEGAAQPSTPRETARVIAPPPANDDRKPATEMKPAIVTTGRKRRIGDGPHLPMELPLSRKPVGHDGRRLQASEGCHGATAARPRAHARLASWSFLDVLRDQDPIQAQRIADLFNSPANDTPWRMVKQAN